MKSVDFYNSQVDFFADLLMVEPPSTLAMRRRTRRALIAFALASVAIIGGAAWAMFT